MNEYVTNTWVNKGNYWYYYDENGYPITADWKYLPINNESELAAYFYFDIEGKRCEDICIRDSKGWCYLNESGEWINSPGAQIEYKRQKYILTSEGYLPEIPLKNEKDSPNDGWAQDYTGEWYCYEKGNPIKNRWVYDTKDWYYLENDGKISKNTIIGDKYFVNNNGQYIYSSKVSDGTKTLYCNNRGIVVKNHWETDYYDRTYYFGDDGAIFKNGWYYIKENSYYFDNNGIMFKNTCKNDSTGMAYLGEDGKWAKGISTLEYKGKTFNVVDGYVQSRKDSTGKYLDGWNCDNQGWFYRENGADKKGWIKNGEDWYYGRPDGYIITNSWEQIEGKWYYFQQDGLMMKNKYWPDSSGKEVFLTETGSMRVNGWVQGLGNVFMYVDSSGYRVEGWKNIEIQLNNEKTAQRYYFVPNKSPINTGKMATGWQRILGERYYFNESTDSKLVGYMITGWKLLLHYESGVYHQTDENNNKTEIPGYYYFDNEGKMVYGKWYSIDQTIKWHIATEEKSGYENFEQTYYLFAEDGRMKTGWYQEDDKWYYLATKEDSKKINSSNSETKYLGACVYGWFVPSLKGGPAGENYDNYYYFIEDSGRVFKNGWKKDSTGLCWLDDEGALIDNTIVSVNNKKYYIGTDQYLVTNKGFYDIDDGTIYVKDFTGELLSNGWNIIGNDWYFFYDTAYMAKNEILFDAKGLCYIRGDGVWYKPGEGKPNIVKNNDNYYFISDDGYIKVNAWVLLTPPEKDPKWAWAEKDGHFSTDSKWIYYDSGWYYITYNNENQVDKYPNIAVTVNGEQTIGGNKYLFNGDEDQGTQKAAQLWVGRWLYSPKKDGDDNPKDPEDPVNWYYADITGKLLANRWVLWEKANDNNNNQEKWIYLDSDHRAAKEKWAKDSKDWCYVGKEGFMVYNQWVERNNSRSYVDDTGHIVRNTTKYDGTVLKYIGENGLLRHNEWIKIEDKWYYLKNGTIVTPSASHIWIEDLGSWYCLKEDGVMMSNQWQEDSVGWCYLGKDGKMYKNRWVNTKPFTINNNEEDRPYWYYIDNKGHVLQFDTGKKVYFINGYYYLFESVFSDSSDNKRYSHLISGVFYEVPISDEQAKEKGENGGKIYYFTDSSDDAILGKGAPFKWEETKAGFSAYYQVDSTLYPYTDGWAKDIKGLRYVKDGYAVKGWCELENQWYYFDENTGDMVTNKWVQWKKENDDNSDGNNSKWCYLNSKGNPVADSTRIIGGKEYTFDKKGYWIG